MNPRRPSPSPALQGERPPACVLGELIAALEMALTVEGSLPWDLPPHLARIKSALEKYGQWSAYNVSKKDQFAIDLARGVLCAHAARPNYHGRFGE
jgi:hypothetical protein